MIFSEKVSCLIKDWHNKSKDWQKDILYKFWNNTKVEDVDIKRSYELAKKEFDIETSHLVANTSFPKEKEFVDVTNNRIILSSLGKVEGVGALSATSELIFNDNLSVVYGQNGCGKSSYIKILKDASDKKSKESFVGNVYKTEKVSPKATFNFKIDLDEKIVKWSPGSKIEYPIQIYDSQEAKNLVETKNEILYEPKILSVFTKISEVYNRVRESAQKDIDIINNDFISCPQEILNQTIIEDYINENRINNLIKLRENIDFKEHEEEFNKLDGIINVQNPEKFINDNNAKINFLNDEIIKINEAFSKMSDSNCRSINFKANDLKMLQFNIKNETNSLNNITKFSNINDSNWTDFWKSSLKLKNVTDKSSEICLYCQQDLDVESKKIIEQFDTFYTSENISNLTLLTNDLKSLYESFDNVFKQSLDLDKINTRLSGSSIEDELKITLIEFYNKLNDRCAYVLKNFRINSEEFILPEIYSSIYIINLIKKNIEDLQISNAAIIELIANREKVKIKYQELLAKKWLSENKKNIDNKILLIKYEQLLSSTKTNLLTTLKKKLSNHIITDEYKIRFNKELEYLDPEGKIKVEIKTNTSSGKSFNEIQLKNAVKQKKIGQVLSEGEHRVVSLASFLADISSWEQKQPFIFDDPITSMDHIYEEMVAKRLVELSKERQVIVFTHRLTFASYIKRCFEEQIDDNNNISFIELRECPLGEPSKSNQYTSKINVSSEISEMEKDVNNIKKMFEEKAFEIADKLINSLCQRFRICIENSIEIVMLKELIKRFDHRIFTLKIRYLKAIKNSDINFIEDLMTKYSKYEHSTSQEINFERITIEEIEEDLISFKKWVQEFKKRQKEFN